MTNQLRDITGYRGEKIVELCLTNYEMFAKPLFRPGFLGDKWPAIDFYVELTGVTKKRLYFFVQVKATTVNIASNAVNLPISSRKQHVSQLLQIPGPTYLLGVHEPSRRVFVRSVHAGVSAKSITRIPLAHELNAGNLRRLHQEVREYWRTSNHKPTSSVFS